MQRTTGDPEANLDYVMFPCALCNDSDIQDGAVVGDPTEGALYVLAQKGGVMSRRSARTIRGSRRSPSTPITSSWQPSTDDAAPTASRSYGHT